MHKESPMNAHELMTHFADDGEARKYFKDATGGAPWIDPVADSIETAALNALVLENMNTAADLGADTFTAVHTAKFGWTVHVKKGDLLDATSSNKSLIAALATALMNYMQCVADAG